MDRITESDSHYDGLENMPMRELLQNINREDHSVPKAIEQIIPEIAAFVEATLVRMKRGGRLFYLGAGTSGRLGIVDASECPPTFGVQQGVVLGLIAGGDDAIRMAVEGAEDDREAGWKDLEKNHVSEWDTVVGIAASGTTPYVIGAIEYCNQKGILTGGITCNPGSVLAEKARYPMVAIVGPEFVTGSTRMKSGTAQKLILNMISTSLMIGLGHVQGNKMIDMQLSNAKLVDRGAHMVANQTGLTIEEGRAWLIQYGSVRNAVNAFLETK